MPMIPSSSELMGSIYLKHLVIKIYIKMVVLRKKKLRTLWYVEQCLWGNYPSETVENRPFY